MKNQNNFDAIIIGGGILGNAVAAYLTQKSKLKVLLLEQNRICTGSTSFSASLVTKLRHQTNLIPFIEETHHAVFRLEKNLGESLGERRVGCLHIASGSDSVKELKKLMLIADNFGITTQTVDKGFIRERVPWLVSEKVKDALFVPDEFFIDGTLLGMAFFKAARQNGLHYQTNCTVTRILSGNNRIIGVESDKVQYKASIIVDTAGIWSNLLLEEHDALLPYAPVRSLYFITEVNAEKYPVNQPICILPDVNAYTRPETGALLFGLRDRGSPWTHLAEIQKDLSNQIFINQNEQWDILMNETAGLGSIMKDFEQLKIAHTIAAPCAYTHDGNPLLGSVNQPEGLFVATGCNEAGIATSAGFGRVIAETVLGEKPFLSINSFNPVRMQESHPLSEEFMQQCSDRRSQKKSG